MGKSKGNFFKKLIVWTILLLLGYASFWTYKNVFKNNVHLNDKKYTYIYIKTNATLDDVLNELYAENIIDDHKSFEWMAKEMNLDENINAGKYRIDAKMSNRSIIKMILNGKQEKVKLFFNSQIRTKENFIEYVSDKLEIDSDELEDYCNNENNLTKKYGIHSSNFMAFILPETYEVNWNISIESLFELLEKSYQTTWTNAKIAKAKNLGYSPAEITTIASIVQSESAIKSEQQKIAGVYLNRLKQDMKLQADPTVVFANKNFEVQRVLSTDKDIDSPYNTYKYKGLPPGPICLVNNHAIDAVLNYSKHSYLYFCAKPDFSGFSNFTNDYTVHQKNAKAYQDALNKKGIKR